MTKLLPTVNICGRSLLFAPQIQFIKHTQHCSTHRIFSCNGTGFQHEATTDLFCRRFALYIGVSWLSSLSELFRLQLNNSRYISICQPIIFYWTFYCTVKCFFRLPVVFFVAYLIYRIFAGIICNTFSAR